MVKGTANKLIVSLLVSLPLLSGLQIEPTIHIGSSTVSASVYGGPVAYFPDVNLKQVIHSWLGKPVTANVYKSDIIAKLDAVQATSESRSFNAVDKGITNLSGLEIFNGTNLHVLELRQNNVTDLTPIRGITSLENLNLESSANATDLTPLANFTKLRQLTLGVMGDSNQTSAPVNLSPISTMTSLQDFSCRGCKLTDVSALQAHPTLQSLVLDNNNIMDLTPLSSVSTLKRLSLFNNDLVNIAPLSALTRMEDLTIQKNNVKDIDAIKQMNSIRNLTISENPINNFKPLSTLSSLRFFTADHTSIKDLSVIKNNTNMQWLSLGDTPVEDLTPLVGMNNLQTLTLQRTNVSDISPIGNIASLSTLWLADNYIDHFNSGTNKIAKDLLSPHLGYGLWTPQRRIAVKDANGVLSQINMAAGSNIAIEVFTQTTTNGTFSGIYGPAEIWPSTYYYSTTDNNVAHVDQTTMQLKAVSDGTATITVKRGSPTATGFQSYSFNVTVVTPITVIDRSINPGQSTIRVGTTQKFKVTAQLSDGSTTDITDSVVWGVQDNNVARMTPSGVAKGLQKGFTLIQASGDDWQLRAVLTVVDENPEIPVVEPPVVEPPIVELPIEKPSTEEPPIVGPPVVDPPATEQPVEPPAIPSSESGSDSGSDSDPSSCLLSPPMPDHAITPPVPEVPVVKPLPSIAETIEPTLYGSIYGTVLDSTGNPLSNVLVELHSIPREAYTDIYGQYHFDHVELGIHTVILKDVDIFNELGRISVVADDTIKLNANQAQMVLTKTKSEGKVDFVVTPIVKEIPVVRQAETQPEPATEPPLTASITIEPELVTGKNNPQPNSKSILEPREGPEPTLSTKNPESILETKPEPKPEPIPDPELMKTSGQPLLPESGQAFPIVISMLLASVSLFALVLLRRKNVEIYQDTLLVGKLRVKANGKTEIDLSKIKPVEPTKTIQVVVKYRLMKKLNGSEITVIQEKGQVIYNRRVESKETTQDLEFTI